MAHAVDPVDEQVLLDLLNSTPVVDGRQHDLLVEEGERDWRATRGGTGTAAEGEHLRAVRDLLQAVVRGGAPAEELSGVLVDVRLRPAVTAAGIDWAPDVAADRALATRALLAWGQVQERMPGRLRPCANDECRLFLLDRSKANSARWCSMKVCGNRMKARRHYQRAQAR